MTTPYDPLPPLDLTVLPAPRIISLTSTNAPKLLISFAGLLTGWSVRETSGTAAADLQAYDGRDSGGQLLATIGLASGGSSALSMALPGWPFRTGLYVAAGSGAWEAVFVVVPLPGGM